MSSAAVQVSATAEASAQSVPLLITCLHASAFSAPLAEVRRVFDIIERLLSNRLQHPAEPRYTSFSATSAVWVNGVAPLVYVLRLAAWMGCTLAAEGARYVFFESLDETHARGPSDDAEGRRQRHAQQQIADRLSELRCVASIWDTSVAESSADASKRYQDAYQKLLKLFQSAQGFTDREEVWARHTHCLQLHRLLACARDGERQQTTSSQATSDVLRREGAAAWPTRAQRELDRFIRAPDSTPLTNAKGASMTRALSALDTQHGRHPECEARATYLADDSLRWLLSHASLCECYRLCESAAAESASSSVGSRESRAAAVPLVPGFSATVAARLRQRAQLERHQRYLDTTGPTYRRLSQEERHRGESLIISIAALLEQISEVTEAQGMVRHDRHEARRLMDNFRQDGDLVKLYALEKKYTAELEEAKLLHGKPFVYAELLER
ncbi:conserved hypothetical protein [Leishmania mexicana MHOM/GT/2001/U1103]|uniref:PUB domain-containing protein n=1 Tax=Leishmania mexicana (strain MHOM/GT/2001/U1103) TaxID=929439 RepID=E9AXH3_LEIMU|nr:conserved hypothetical protein [Leishmania mexicana MHOM/GT/2001/U1103]CBZ27664.1 conserved hypothetical protein [Leishmania mexicana MHOM/GT/2001/U1103]